MTTTKNFGLTGIELITFAVEDLETACRFARDWGLAPGGSGKNGDGLRFLAADGSGVEFVLADVTDPARRPVGDASGMLGVTWGVDRPERLVALREELGTDRAAVVDDDGVLHSVDDLGFQLSFRVTRRQGPAWEPTRYNAPTETARVDQRAAQYQRAQPYEVSHLAISVDDAGEASRFYEERLGFIVSDRYASRGLFMRCAPEGNHHNLFLMNGRQPGTRFNHLAWKVRDHHEVILGGQFIDAEGWRTFAGPGRHLVSSAIFWYFLTPFGGSWEYAADEDMVTDAWQPKDFAAESHIFSQWTFGLEKSDGTLRGPISQSAERDLGELGIILEAEEEAEEQVERAR